MESVDSDDEAGCGDLLNRPVLDWYAAYAVELTVIGNQSQAVGDSDCCNHQVIGTNGNAS